MYVYMFTYVQNLIVTSVNMRTYNYVQQKRLNFFGLVIAGPRAYLSCYFAFLNGYFYMVTERVGVEWRAAVVHRLRARLARPSDHDPHATRELSLLSTQVRSERA